MHYLVVVEAAGMRVVLARKRMHCMKVPQGMLTKQAWPAKAQYI